MLYISFSRGRARSTFQHVIGYPQPQAPGSNDMKHRTPPFTLAIFAGTLVATFSHAQTTTADASKEDALKLSPYQVISSTDKGYIATRASGATKTA